jgi:hypothetical protein
MQGFINFCDIIQLTDHFDDLISRLGLLANPFYLSPPRGAVGELTNQESYK